MNKLEKKIKKAQKELKILKDIKKKHTQSWEMFEPAGCHECNYGQLYSGGESELSITYYKRCKCANIKTKKYKKFLKDSNNMILKEYIAMESLFYDNNKHITVGDNETDRSW